MAKEYDQNLQRRRRRRGCIRSVRCPEIQEGNFQDVFRNSNQQWNVLKSAATTAAVTITEDNQKQSSKLPRPPTCCTNQPSNKSSKIISIRFHHPCLLIILLILNSLTLTYSQSQRSGITYGSVINLDRCYSAMQNAQIDNKISRTQYVPFIQELANNQFKSFQYNVETDEWGMFPVTEFNSFPEGIRQEFNLHACGGKDFVCPEAYLYTDGTAPNDPVPEEQQEVYLYQVCTGVEDAIEASLPKTEKPTSSPTTTATTVSSSPTGSPTIPVVEETLLLDYQIQVPSYITEGGFQNDSSSGESESTELKEALLEAVQTWVEAMSNDLSQVGNDTTKRQRRRRSQNGSRRQLIVTMDPDRVQFTNVTTAVCNTDSSTQNTNTQESDDKCLNIQMAIPLLLSGVHSLTPDEIKVTFQTKFDEALKDGSFMALLPPEVQSDILGVSPSIPGNDSPPRAEAAPTPVVAPTQQQPVTSPSIPESLKAPEPAPAPSPPTGGNSSVAGIAAGVSVGLVVIIAGFFVFNRRRMHKKRFDNTDSTPSFGKRDSNETQPYNRGILSAFAPKRREIRSDDLEWGQGPIQERSDDESDSMQSYSSHSSSGSHSSSYYSTTDSSRSRAHSDDGHDGPASVSASSASSYEEYPDNLPQPVNTSLTSGKSSSSSEKEKPAEVEKTVSQLYGFNDSEGSDSYESLSNQAAAGAVLAPDYLQAQDRIDADDDSSAGSSGWESSDGDSSVRTGSVESFDPNVESLGTSISPSHDGTASYLEEMEDRQLMPDSLNPAVNPVVQRGVTMIPVDEGDEGEEDSTYMSEDSENPLQNREDVAPMTTDLDRAIEAGDWAAVGATAAILASDSERENESTVFSSGTKSASASIYSSDVSTKTGFSATTDYTEDSIDAARVAEIDQLVETGNWDGVVAVAARYADDASMQSSANRSGRPKGDDDSHHSDESASIESATSHVTGTTRGSNKSSPEGSRGSTMLSAGSSGGSSSQKSVSRSSNPEDLEEDMDTRASSITSSYVSRSGITSSMVSQTSTMSQEKQQMNMYRAEVEALVRRVVPDEIDNIDDIMVQFSGREEELIETLKAMQEKSIAQRARAAVQRTAKREKGVTGRSSQDDSSMDLTESQNETESYDTHTKSSRSSNYSSAYTSSGAGDSITADFTGISYDSYSNPSGSSYMSRSHGGSYSGSDSGYSTHSGEVSDYIDDRTRDDSYVSTEHVGDDGTHTTQSSLSGAVDASDWRAMGMPAERLGETKSSYGDKDPIDDILLRRSGDSEADRASGRPYKP